MRVAVVYKYESDHAREVLDYLRDFSRQTGHDIEEIDPDTPDGTGFCRTYDIVEYPTMVALSDGGQLQSMWRGRPLPTISEVSFYV
mgnify:FL=1|jgi:hypothetical protein